MGRWLAFRRRKLKRVAWLIAGGVVLAGFQNCAPASVIPNSTNSVGDGEVRVIDDWALNKINIYDQVIEVTDELSVQGFCSRQMGTAEPLVWQLATNLPGESGLSGSVTCTGGGFRVEVPEVEDLRCGQIYDFSIRTEDGHEDHASVVKPCSS